jgi:hypothetical protein
MADRREMLEAALEDALEPQDEGKPVDTEEEVHAESEAEVSQDEPVRDEKGRFVAKEETPAEEASPENIAEDTTEAEQPEEQPTVGDIPKPTTWKKDLLPLWDKIAKAKHLHLKKVENTLNTLTNEKTNLKRALAYIKRKRNEQRLLRKRLIHSYLNSKHKESTQPHG